MNRKLGKERLGDMMEQKEREFETGKDERAYGASYRDHEHQNLLHVEDCRRGRRGEDLHQKQLADLHQLALTERTNAATNANQLMAAHADHVRALNAASEDHLRATNAQVLVASALATDRQWNVDEVLRQVLQNERFVEAVTAKVVERLPLASE